MSSQQVPPSPSVQFGQQRSQCVELLVDLSTRFMTMDVTQVDDEVSDALGRVLEYFHADQCGLLEFAHNPASVIFTHAVCREGLDRIVRKNDFLESFPWFCDQVLQGKPGRINGIEDCPPHALIDRQSYQAMGLGSLLMIPLVVRERFSKALVIIHKSLGDTPSEEQLPVLTLLGGMLVNMLERKKDRLNLEKQLNLEILLSGISTRFVNLPADQIDSGIEEALCRICELLELDRATLWQVPEQEPDTAVLTHIHQVPGCPIPPIRMNSMGLLPWTTSRILAGETVVISSMTDLPPEAARDVETYQVYTKSTVSVPLSIGGGKVFGAVAFALTREERDWPDPIVMGFKLVAQMFANALARKLSDKAIGESEERFRVTFEQAGAGIAHVSPAGEFLRINQKLCDIVGYTREEMYQRRFQDITHPDDLSGDLVQFGELISGKIGSYSREKRYIHKDGRVVWSNLTVAPVRDEAGRTLWMISIVEDIGARKQLEEQLREQVKEIETLKQRLERENIYLQEEIKLLVEHTDIVGQSSAMKKVLRQAEQVAKTDSTVLLLGETGTGKELLARAIHSMSLRKERALVTVNCAALPPTLIESELFGREKGAYTGALTRMIGRFELADRSTLFLDEIGELPLELQSKLLRLLEEGTFERVGSAKSLHVDVRIIAATNRDLAAEVKKGAFRSDLFYRLNVFPILIPPLRERIEDIPHLVRAIVQDFQKRMGKEVESIPKKTMQALMSYVWPGNVRELRNLIEHAMIVSGGKILDVRVPKTTAGNSEAYRATLQDTERSHILAVLDKTGWRISGPGGAAELLGLKRTTLQAKMKKLGIIQFQKSLPK